MRSRSAAVESLPPRGTGSHRESFRHPARAARRSAAPRRAPRQRGPPRLRAKRGPGSCPGPAL